MDRLPYPGLRAFNRDEADLFFGRDAAVNELILRLSQTRFLAVLGASGTGKSSLVRTGLLDGLELGLHPAGANWRFCDMAPGGQPIRSLARGLLQVSAGDEGREDPSEDDIESLEWFLRRGPRSLIEWLDEGHLPSDVQLLLLVDQFEELFRFGDYDDREEAEAFVQLLIHASREDAGRMHVVITMRSEFLGACVLIPDLAETINAGTYLTPRMDREGCRKAIVGPARMFGRDVEPALVNRLLNDLATFAPFDEQGGGDQLRALSRRADQLPVMQHVLNRIWREEVVGKDAQHLSYDKYEDLGGMKGALNQHGGQVLDELGSDKLTACEKIFRALVDGNSIITASRRPVALGRLAQETGLPVDEVRAIVEVFRSEEVNFLRPPPSVPLSDDSVIDISHESLIRQWSKLSEWMLDEARAAAVMRRVADARSRYEAGEGDLLSGLDLANITSWWEHDQPSADWGQRYTSDFEGLAAYLRRSQETEEARQKARQEKDAREKRTLRFFLAATSATAIAAAFFFFDAQAKRDEAITLRNTAEVNEAHFLAVTESLATGLVETLDTDDTIPVASKYSLIRDTEAAIAALAESRADDVEFVDQRATFLLASLDALRAGGFWNEAEDYARQLEALLLEKPADWSPAPVLEIRSSIALADFHRVYARLESADRWLQRAQEQNELTDPETPGYLARQAQILLADAQIAKQWHLHERLLDTARKIWSEFDRQMAIIEAPQVSRNRQRDPAAFGQKQLALAELAHTVVMANGFAANTVRKIDADTRYGVDYPQLQISAQRAVDFLERVEGFDEGELGLAEIMLNGMKAAESNDNDNKSLRAVEFMDSAVRIAETLCALDTTNRRYRSRLLGALTLRANYAIDAGQLGQASRDLSAANDLLLELRAARMPRTERISREPWLRYYEWQYVVARDGDKGNAKAIARQQLHDSVASLNDDSSVDSRLLSEAKMLAAYVDLFMLTRDEVNYADIQETIRAAMSAHPVADSPQSNAYFNLAQRQFLHYQLIFAGAKRLGEEEWARAYDLGFREADALLKIAPGEYRWTNNQTSYLWSSAEATRGAGKQAEAIELYRDAFDSAMNAAGSKGIREREYFRSIENAVKLMRNVVGLGEELLDETDVARLDDLVAKHVADTDRFDSLIENKRQLEALAKEAKELSEKMSGSADEGAQGISRGLREASVLISEAVDQAVFAEAASTKVARNDTGEVIGALAREKLRELTMDELEGEAIFWVRPPLYEAVWHTLEGDAFNGMLDTITAGVPGFDVSEVSYIRSTRLSFYDDGYLVEMQLGVGDQARLIAFLVTNGDSVFRLSGTSPPIHEANAKTPIVLNTQEQVAAYLRFFTHYVNGDEGSFSIVESTADIPFSETAGEEEFDRAQAVMRPFAIWPHPENPELWQASGTVYYGRALFHAIFELQRTGLIEMLNDQPVIADLEASLIRISDREQGVRLNGEEAGKSVAFERIGLKRHETRVDRIVTVISSSRNMPEAAARKLRDDHIGFLLHELYEKESSDHARDRNNVAYELLLADVDPEVALNLSELVRKDAPDDPNYADTYGWALLKSGQTDKAIDILEQAKSEAPDSVEIIAHLAQAYRVAGRSGDAKKMLDTAEAFELKADLAAFLRNERNLLAQQE
ncbi:tetratricopeptide repeat protein [Roseovarius sp. CAU 1744]|uniref:nSTAND1 domain-containing NTPase n=1 Tax=Roseovarius sp. CAU 1744 TaxID=3140368 RepID=UPI00325BB94E